MDESKQQATSAGAAPQPSPNGRTPWDFATEAIRSRTAMLLVVLLAFVLPLTIHFVAEPGSEVSIFTLIRYKKAAERIPQVASTPTEPAPVPASAPPATPDSYFTPTKLKVRNESVTAILDRAVNIQPIRAENDKTICRLGGANLTTLKAAVRRLNGNPAKLESSGRDGPVEATLEDGCYFEIEYRGLVFSVEVVDAGYPQYELTVARQAQSTLSLATPPVK